jgi:aspartokinase-like uncharacterized kinase
MFDALIKVGGSLYSDPGLRNHVATWSALAAKYRLLLVPGGGPFADQVRTADHCLNLSDEAAHWMAILAMDQYAYLLADLAPDAMVVHDISTATAQCTTGRLPILAPSALLRDIDPLPHSWQVTSDSIAAWITSVAQVKLLVLLKRLDGVVEEQRTGKLQAEVSRQTLAHSGVVDPYFMSALSSHTKCWILNGGYPDRLAELLGTGSAYGTRVQLS